MSVLIADSSLGVMAAAEGVPNRSLPCGIDAPYMPAAGREGLFVCCRKSLDCLCLRASDFSPLFRVPAQPGLTALCPSPCGRYLYQLSGETDAIHALRLSTGDLCYAAPAGVFPRSLRLHPTGRWLLAAGGAMKEARLFSAPKLTREATVCTKGACFAADFWQGGLLLVCATEEEDIQTSVCTLAPGKLRPREIQRLPGQPGGLCVCPDGLSALLSTPDGLMKLDIRTGKLLWNLPQWALCMGLRCKGGMALVSDTLGGQVCLLCHEQPWISRVLARGTDAQACFYEYP